MVQESSEPGNTPEELYLQISRVIFDLGGKALDLFRDGETRRLALLANGIGAVENVAVDLTPSPRESSFEYGIWQEDDSTAYIRLWDNCFEINGNRIFNDKLTYGRETLELFIRHTGEGLTVKDAIEDPYFLPENSNPSRASAFYRNAKLFREWSGETGLFVNGLSPPPDGKSNIRWWGINVEPEPEPQSQSQPIPEPSIPLETPEKPLQEYVFQREDGSEIIVRIGDDSYEINGLIVDEVERFAWKRRTFDLLKIFIEWKGQPLTMKDIIDEDFLGEEQLDEKKRIDVIRATLSRLIGISGDLIRSDYLGTTIKKWWGIGVSKEAVAELEKMEDLIKPDSPEPELAETIAPEEKRQPDLELLKQLDLSTIEEEIVNYIINHGEGPVDLRKLIKEKPGIPITVDILRRRIIPGLQRKIIEMNKKREKSIPLTLAITDVSIDNDTSPHLYIMAQ